jgi:hypothetical protein
MIGDNVPPGGGVGVGGPLQVPQPNPDPPQIVHGLNLPRIRPEPIHPDIIQDVPIRSVVDHSASLPAGTRTACDICKMIGKELLASSVAILAVALDVAMVLPLGAVLYFIVALGQLCRGDFARMGKALLLMIAVPVWMPFAMWCYVYQLVLRCFDPGYILDNSWYDRLNKQAGDAKCNFLCF